MRLFLCSCAYCTALMALAPDTVWTRTYGGSRGDGGQVVLEAPGKGYLVAATTWSFGAGAMDLWLLRLDSLGDTLWTRTYGWEGTVEDPRCGVSTYDSCFVLAGYTGVSGSINLLVLKVDNSGDTVWCKRTAGDFGYAYAIQQTPDSGFMLTGGRETPGLDDLLLVRLDPEGETLWTKSYGGAQTDDGWDLEPAGDGGWYVVGSTQSFGAGWSDAWLLRVDSLGDTLWARTYGDAETQSARSMCPTTDGGFVLAGGTKVVAPGTYPDIWLVRVNRDGDVLWTRTYGDPFEDAAWAVEPDPAGGYIVAGTWGWLSSELGSFWLAEFSEAGDTLWSRTHGGPGQEICLDALPVTHGGYILAGWTDLWGAGGADAHITRLSATAATDEGAAAIPPATNGQVSIVRIVLWLGVGTGAQPGASDALGLSRAALLDITGRKVLDLRPGANDVSGLAPALYFVRDAQARAIRKVVITR